MRFKLIPVVPVFVLVGLSISFAGRRWNGDLTVPPPDSAEAERVRIWVPIERRSRCRLKVDILDDSSRVIRHLVDRLMSRGYYNFYWDKKDDSGEFVRPGAYAYRVSSCGRKVYGEVQAQFKKWEAASRVYPPEERWSTSIGFELLADSALVSIYVHNRLDKLVDSPMVDSLMNKGTYGFEWLPGKNIPRGVYSLKLSIGDFVHTIEIGYRGR